MEKTDLSKEEWRNKAAHYCAGAEHCESEIREKFRQWGTPAEWSDEIVDYLYDNNYINDERYCRAYVHDKLHYNGWGRIKIRAMLQARRLSKAAITAAIASIDEEEYASIRRKVAEKKKNATPIEVARFLASRGFEVTYPQLS